MKILIHSNAPWCPSGYGVQTALLSERLNRDHDVAISAYWGLRGSVLTFGDVPVYPSGIAPYGSDVISKHAEHWFGDERGLCITLMDVWVLKKSALKDLPLASWVPLDHSRMPFPVREYFQETGAVPIAMSKFGREQIAKDQLWKDKEQPPFYVPHMIDTQIFCPRDREECRKELHMPQGAFVVGIVAANQGTPSRKCFPESFAAMSKFMKNHDDVILYLHTDTDGQNGQGVQLERLAEYYGVPSKRVMECDQYLYRTGLLSPDYLARAYSACDVLLNPSMGEGFGVCLIESQACGTPVIATNATAMPEVVGAGWLVEGVQSYYSGIGGEMVIPDVEHIAQCLEEAYERADLLRDQVREFALRYDVETVYVDYWKPTIEGVAELMRSKQIMELEPADAVV